MIVVNQYKEITPEELNKSVFQMIGNEWMLITAKKDGKANTMTASWGGLGVMWGKNVCFAFVRPQRYTREFIDASDSFTLTFFDEKYKKELGYLGKVSGRDEDKITKSGLTLSECDGAPSFEEAKTVMVCKKLYAGSYRPEDFVDKSIIDECYKAGDFHRVYVGKITKIYTR